MQLKPVKAKLTNKERQRLCTELYYLIDLSFQIFKIYPRTEHLNQTFRERLERLYALMRAEYYTIVKICPEIKQSAVVFEKYSSLFGANWELAQEWLIGEPIDPNGSFNLMSGAEDDHKSALGVIKSQYYLAGGKSMQLPKNSKIKSLYQEAQEALDFAKYVQVLNDKFIPKYTLEWNDKDYKLMINGVYCLATTKEGSRGTKIMAEIMKHKNDDGTVATFTVDIGASSRPVSQIMNSDLHIDRLIRRIFFDGSRANTICFRSPVTKDQLNSEGVDTSDLDIKLVASGEKAQPKPKPR